ncbi:MAG: hypothetical protein QNL04_01075 [SAR324 cluster bacterium]|nr:hypothetical protein [SAR324 cluster bacterium]
MNHESLISQVQKNCDRADSKYAHSFSLCSFLLHMRRYYRWNNQIAWTDPINSAEVIEWIMDKEDYWENLEEQDFADLKLQTTRDAFDIEYLNQELEKKGLVYGGGLAPSGRALFSLAELEEKRQIEDFELINSGKDLARALLQGEVV